MVKSLVAEKEPALLELRGRLSVMHKIENRFRFLAADPSSLIQGRRPCYRETLLSIRDRRGRLEEPREPSGGMGRLKS